jgi:hypothetical protein
MPAGKQQHGAFILRPEYPLDIGADRAYSENGVGVGNRERVNGS